MAESDLTQPNGNRGSASPGRLSEIGNGPFAAVMPYIMREDGIRAPRDYRIISPPLAHLVFSTITLMRERPGPSLTVLTLSWKIRTQPLLRETLASSPSISN